MKLAIAGLGVLLLSAGPVEEEFRGVSASAPTGSGAIGSGSLIAAYDMSTVAEDGRLKDFSGRGHHGTFAALLAPVASRFGQARTFRSVDDRVHLEEHPDFDIDGPLTIAMWVRVDELGLHQHAVACDDKWALWVTPDDRYRLGDTHGGGWSSRPGAVEKGAWKSVVAVLNGTKGDPLTDSTVALYVDGELADAERHLRTDEARELGRWSPEELFPSDACYIGFESHQGNDAHQSMPFVGAVDELLIFARAWSEREVRAFAATAP